MSASLDSSLDPRLNPCLDTNIRLNGTILKARQSLLERRRSSEDAALALKVARHARGTKGKLAALLCSGAPAGEVSDHSARQPSPMEVHDDFGAHDDFGGLDEELMSELQALQESVAAGLASDVYSSAHGEAHSESDDETLLEELAALSAEAGSPQATDEDDAGEASQASADGQGVAPGRGEPSAGAEEQTEPDRVDERCAEEMGSDKEEPGANDLERLKGLALQAKQGGDMALARLYMQQIVQIRARPPPAEELLSAADVEGRADERLFRMTGFADAILQRGQAHQHSAGEDAAARIAAQATRCTAAAKACLSRGDRQGAMAFLAKEAAFKGDAATLCEAPCDAAIERVTEHLPREGDALLQSLCKEGRLVVVLTQIDRLAGLAAPPSGRAAGGPPEGTFHVEVSLDGATSGDEPILARSEPFPLSPRAPSEGGGFMGSPVAISVELPMAGRERGAARLAKYFEYRRLRLSILRAAPPLAVPKRRLFFWQSAEAAPADSPVILGGASVRLGALLSCPSAYFDAIPLFAAAAAEASARRRTGLAANFSLHLPPGLLPGGASSNDGPPMIAVEWLVLVNGRSGPLYGQGPHVPAVPASVDGQCQRDRAATAKEAPSSLPQVAQPSVSDGSLLAVVEEIESHAVLEHEIERTKQLGGPPALVEALREKAQDLEEAIAGGYVSEAEYRGIVEDCLRDDKARALAAKRAGDLARARMYMHRIMLMTDEISGGPNDGA